MTILKGIVVNSRIFRQEMAFLPFLPILNQYIKKDVAPGPEIYR
jgi:hypothetical protein